MVCRWVLVVVWLSACSSGSTPRREAPPQPTAAPTPCTGELRFALVAPLYAPVDDLDDEALRALWSGSDQRGASRRRLDDQSVSVATTAATRAALAHLGTPGGELLADGARPEVTDKRWAIVPADQLAPAWKVVTTGGIHPLAKDARGPLTVATCGAGTIDPAAITTVAMTGVTAMARITALLIDKEGAAYPTRDVAPWFAGTDFVHVSNEVSFVPACEPTADQVQPFCARESYIDALEALHVNVVELSGSHLLDHGTRWLAHTIEMYETRGWKFFGGGRNQVEATRPLLVEHAGNKLAFIGCNMPRSTSNTIRNGPNVAFCDLARLDWQVRDLRHRGFAPIVSIQHEEVKTHEPPFVVVRDFRRLADAGAAVVFGSQAHVAHPWEVHAGAYLHYGAGNFIFDQPWNHTRDGVADRFYFHRGKLLAVDRLFTRLEDQGRPRPMKDAERAKFLATLGAAIGTVVPPSSPWAAPKSPAPERSAPDSFLVGTEAVLVRVASPESPLENPSLVIDLRGSSGTVPDAFTVSLRKWPTVPRARLVAAITDFMVAKYAVDRQRVTIRPLHAAK